MKYTCEMIRDLLPLYLDGVCSAESRKAVNEHLLECAECQKYYLDLCSCERIEQNAYDAKRSGDIAKSYKQAKKKKLKEILPIAGIAMLVVIAFCVILTLILSGVMIIGGLIQKPTVHTDIADYNAYIGVSEEDGHRHRLIDESIWPRSISEEMNVVEFKLVYYDPWDPQYLGYMIVDYDDAAYAKEMQRLKFERQMDYIGYYGATGFDDYEVAAMYADESGDGLVYALTDGEHRVAYVLLEFCNFFFDLKYENYIPSEYLPTGFNAHEGNPYRDEWYEKVFGVKRGFH